MDDARARLPEPDSVLGRDGLKEVVDLGVDIVGHGEIDAAFALGLDEMVAVDGGGDCSLGKTGGHELQQCHLSGGVLHGDAIGVEIGIAAAALEFLVLRIAQMVDENLLGKGKRTAEALTAERDSLGEAAVDGVDQFDRSVGGNSHGGAFLNSRRQCVRTTCSIIDNRPADLIRR